VTLGDFILLMTMAVAIATAIFAAMGE